MRGITRIARIRSTPTQRLRPSIALCIVADARAQTRPRLIELATRIASRTVELLWIERRRSFGNQVNRRWTNTREFMRWTNAPMFEALARLLSQGSALR